MKLLSKSLLGTLLLVVFTWTGVAVAEPPTSVKMAAILTVGPDEAWDGQFLDAWEKVRAENPHGLELNEPIYTSGVWGDSAEAIARIYAKKYDIVWLHSTYSDQVKRIQKKFPDTLFVVAGSGNQALGGNQYWVFARSYEPAYVMGVIAGLTTKTNVLGAVGAFSSEEVNDTMNSFFEGAKSVNPNIKQRVTFIDSWWDPPMAFEASKAQIATGADQILMLSHAFEGCKQHKLVCYGGYRDWYKFAPDVIAASATLEWEPHIRWVIGEWYQAKSSEQPFNGNTEPRFFSMSEGGSSLALGDFPHPPEILKKAEDLVAKIKSGELKVPLITTLPVSN